MFFLKDPAVEKVFIYARVSSKMQAKEEKDGLPRQILACESFCAKNNYHIARTFRDPHSGSDEFKDRKVLLEAINLAGSFSPYHVNIIIVECADRIARDVLVQELFFEQCRKDKIRVFAADSGIELVNATGDPSVTMFRQFLGIAAQAEKTRLVNRLWSGKCKKRAATGQPCGGPRRYDNQEVIDDIVRYRFQEGRSFREIAALLNDRKIPTRYGGKRWHASTVFYIYRYNAPQGPAVWGPLLKQALNQE